MKRSALLLAAVLVGLLALAGPAAAQVTPADSPGEGIIDVGEERDGGRLPAGEDVGGVVTTGEDVAAVDAGLAQTGFNLTVGAALALGLVAGGTLLLVVTRRRRADLGQA